MEALHKVLSIIKYLRALSDQGLKVNFSNALNSMAIWFFCMEKQHKIL